MKNAIIWRERNSRWVEEAPQSSARLISLLDKLIRNRISFLRKTVGDRHADMRRLWRYGLEVDDPSIIKF